MVEELQINIENEEAVLVHATERASMEFVVVCKSGNTYLLDRVTRQTSRLGHLDFSLRYSEDYFSHLELHGGRKALLQLNTFEKYVCVTQKYGTNGVVFDIERPQFKKLLKRGEYHVEQCTFPIAFYSANGSTYLIHGTDWNRLDITDLDSDRLLTAREVDYKSKLNYLDYFHSSLTVSPDSQRFASNGWVWGPCDVITVYAISHFLREFEGSNMALDFAPVDGYNWDRPLCWVDSSTICVGYNRREAGENVGSVPSEILFVDILTNRVINRIEFDGFALSDYGAPEGELYYDQENCRFTALNSISGLLVSSVDGTPIASDRSMTSHSYSPRHRSLYSLDTQNQTLAIATFL